MTAGAGSMVGLVLAAGAGVRMGRTKALMPDDDGVSWLQRAVETLRDGGADPVYVVIGAEADAVRQVVPLGCVTVEAVDWREGMGASLRAGLSAVTSAEPDAASVVIVLVDTPDVGADAVRRVASGADRSTLLRATYEGQPGHPVLIGRDHWRGVLDTVHGDTGARDYLRRHDVETVECADLATGADIDYPPQRDCP